MLKEQAFQADDVTINYVEGPPSGPPLVLLHGGGDRWQHFWPLIPSLVMRWHVYALDLRGHGRSGRAPGQYLPEYYVADIASFLECQVAGPAVLFGHSLGGWIALMTTAQRENQARALVLGDPPLDIERFLAFEGSKARIEAWKRLRDVVGGEPGVRELASRLGDLPISVPGKDEPVRYADLPGTDSIRLREWAKTLSQVDPDVAQYHAEGRLQEYVAEVDLDAALRQVTCPVLLLQADPSRGGMVADDAAEHALSLLRDGVRVQLEGKSHDLGLGAWEVAPLLRALTGFLESL